jgi:uncharacterized protein (TIGR03435 family)
VSLAELIMDAYKIKKFQIAGLPPWGDSQTDMYDLDAKVEGESPPSVDQVRLMLQAFLADRFQLRIHHESRLLPVYALVPGKKGVKLFPNKDTVSCPVIPGLKATPTSPRRRNDLALPWCFAAEQVAARAQRPVINETGLDGDATYCTVDQEDPLLAVMFAMDTGDGASVFTSVEDKWGMKLESRKASVDVVAIDKVEKPSAN